MNWAAIAAASLLANIGLAAPGAAEAAAIKPGLWQFRTSLEPAAPAVAAPPPVPQRAAPEPADASNATARYTICLDPARPLPAEFGPRCKLDGVERRGARFSWAMTCTNSESKVRSDGVAQYHGNTMEATMVSRLPARNGAVADTTQRITGTYLGPCRQPADLPLTPSHFNPSRLSSPPKADSDTIEPAAAQQNAAAMDSAAAAGAPPTDSRPRHRRSARRHFRHYRYHYRYYGAALGSRASGGYGPGP